MAGRHALLNATKTETKRKLKKIEMRKIKQKQKKSRTNSYCKWSTNKEQKGCVTSV